MSEELKRKLYSYEADPPEIVWNRIASALDQEINAEFPQKLYSLEQTPPAELWERIEEGLEKDSKEHYPTRLYNVEASPPPQVWGKILTSLDGEKALPEIPPRRWVISFVRYAAAACIIGLLAFGAFKLLNQKTGNAPVTVKTTLPQKDSSPGLNQNPIQQATPALSNNLPKERPVFAQAETKHRKKTLPEPSTYMIQMAATSPSATGSGSMSDFRQVSLKGDIPGNCSQIS